MRSKLKIISVFLILALLVNVFALTMKVIAGAPTDKSTFADIEIGGDVTGIADVNSGSTVTATYSNGNTVTVTGSNLYSEKTQGLNENNEMVDKYFVYATGDVTVTAVPASGYTATLWDNGTNLKSTTKNYTNLTAGNHERIDAEFNDQSNPNPGGGQNNGPVYIEGGTEVTGHFTYENSGNGDPADIWLNKTEIGVGEPPAESKNYYYVESTGTVTFDFGTFINNRITSIIINGTNYTNQLPTTKEGWLEVNQGQIDMVSITVPYADTYNIVTTTTRDFEWSVGNFLWSYMDQDKGTDNYIGNGTLEFVSLKYKDTTYDSLSALKALNKPYMDFGENDENTEGGAVLPAGAELTVKLVPDAGYQLTSFTCNGQTFKTQEQIGYYTFDIPDGNFHWGATFEKVDDLVKTNSDTVQAGTIKLGGTESSMSIGTARLDVADTTVSSQQTANFKEAAGDYKVSDYLDISLFNTVYKGTAASSWDTEVTTLDNDANISLKLDDSTNGEDAVIVHEKHDGTYEVIETEYDKETNSISFTTKSFSNYAIATKTTSVEENTETATTTGSNPKTGDNIILITTVFTVATLGAFTMIKLRKNRKVRKH